MPRPDLPRSRALLPALVPTLMPALALSLGALTAGCGGGTASRASSSAERHSLTEGRALEVLATAIEEAGLRAVGGWSVPIGGELTLEVDLRLAAASGEASAFGIEWISEQDRLDLGDAVPHPDPEPIRVIRGSGEAAGAQVLLLEHDNYTYVRGLEREGEASAEDAEARLRRDLRDFLEHARTQGGL